MMQAQPADTRKMQAHRSLDLTRVHACDNPDCGALYDTDHVEPVRCEYCGKPVLDCAATAEWMST